VRDLALEALKIAGHGLKRRARLNASGADEAASSNRWSSSRSPTKPRPNASWRCSIRTGTGRWIRCSASSPTRFDRSHTAVDADADGAAHRSPGKQDALLGPGATQALGDLAGARQGHAHEHHGKLLASDPAHDITGAQVFAQQGREAAQHLVAGGVAVDIVDLLEVVQVEHQHMAGAGRPVPLQHPSCLLEEALPVEQTGEAIGRGQATQQALLCRMQQHQQGKAAQHEDGRRDRCARGTQGVDLPVRKPGRIDPHEQGTHQQHGAREQVDPGHRATQQPAIEFVGAQQGETREQTGDRGQDLVRRHLLRVRQRRGREPRQQEGRRQPLRCQPVPQAAEAQDADPEGKIAAEKAQPGPPEPDFVRSGNAQQPGWRNRWPPAGSRPPSDAGRACRDTAAPSARTRPTSPA
jgi:hypothetical protein